MSNFKVKKIIILKVAVALGPLLANDLIYDLILF